MDGYGQANGWGSAGSVVYKSGDAFYITIDAKNVKDFNDVVDMAKMAQQAGRAG